MGWDKNTVNQSRVDSIVETLRKLNVSYTLNIMDFVHGIGQNDESGSKYPIRRLQYADYVVLEQMYRTNDCDADDVISSHEFKKDQEPKNWKVLEIEPFSVNEGVTMPDGFNPVEAYVEMKKQEEDIHVELNEQDDSEELAHKTKTGKTIYNLDENDPEFYEP